MFTKIILTHERHNKQIFPKDIGPKYPIEVLLGIEGECGCYLTFKGYRYCGTTLNVSDRTIVKAVANWVINQTEVIYIDKQKFCASCMEFVCCSENCNFTKILLGL